MDRFSRQRGLVRQEMVTQLKVAFEPKSPLPKALIEALTLIGEHLGVETFPCDPDHANYTVNWPTPQGTEEDRETKINAAYGATGVFLDGHCPDEQCHPMYETALSTITASLVWSEILRRAGCYLPIEVPKVSVSVNVRVNENALYSNLNALDIRLDGHTTTTNIRETADGSSHRRVLLRLDENDPIAQQLVERLCIEAEPSTVIPQYPVVNLNLPLPNQPLRGHITIVGAGGLGTWCLHNLVGGIKKTERSQIEFLVFDKDLEVEEHNLNRQVLFTKSDVGSSKIAATRRWMQNQLKEASIDVAWELEDSMAADTYSAAEGGLDLNSLIQSEAANTSEDVDPLTIERVLPLLKRTDAIVGCLDAMRPRVLADLLAAKINQPYINGGVKHFVAEYREFTQTNLVERHGPQVAQDRKVFSCQEDGHVPMTSIVLTNAYAGAFQSIAVLQRLAGRPKSTVESSYWNAHSNEVYVTEASDLIVKRQVSVAQIEQALWPETHEPTDNNHSDAPVEA